MLQGGVCFIPQAVCAPFLPRHCKQGGYPTLRKLYAHISCPGIANKGGYTSYSRPYAHLSCQGVATVCALTRPHMPCQRTTAYQPGAPAQHRCRTACACSRKNTRFRFPFPIVGNNLLTAGAAYRQRCESLALTLNHCSNRCSPCPPERPQGLNADGQACQQD